MVMNMNMVSVIKHTNVLTYLLTSLIKNMVLPAAGRAMTPSNRDDLLQVVGLMCALRNEKHSNLFKTKAE